MSHGKRHWLPHQWRAGFGVAVRVRLLEALIAVGAGAALGRFAPLPEHQELFALPPIAAAPPVISAAEPSQTAGAVSLSAPHAEAVGISPRGAATWAMDTFPAAPTTAIIVADGISPNGDRNKARSVIRIIDARAAAEPESRMQYSNPCGVVIGDASSARGAECRSAEQRRRQAMCPPKGDPRHQGPIICIQPSGNRQ